MLKEEMRRTDSVVVFIIVIIGRAKSLRSVDER
jgi:hypothetical protein